VSKTQKITTYGEAREALPNGSDKQIADFVDADAGTLSRWLKSPVGEQAVALYERGLADRARRQRPDDPDA
jgi:hypothetical protein